MLQLLLESGARRAARRAGSTLASVLMHALLVGAAVVVTTRDPMQPRVVEPAEDVFFTTPRQPAHVLPPSLPSISETAARIIRQMSTITVPFVSPIDLTPGASAPLQAPTFGPEPTGIVSHALPADRIYDVTVVERAASPWSDNPRPDYPTQLRSAALEGEVLARFVVDSAGRVERSSIVIVQATHALFGDAVRRWLPRTRYAPAEIQGRPVRQLVQQSIGFALRP